MRIDPLFSAAAIRARVDELAERIAHDQGARGSRFASTGKPAPSSERKRSAQRGPPRAKSMNRPSEAADVLVVLCIAEGARRFTDDLLAALALRGLHPERIEVRARRSAGTSLGPVTIDPFDPGRLRGRDVLVVDDIADEGATLRALLGIAATGEPRSLRTAVLLDKRERRSEPLALDYVGFVVESGWVVGYGMDLDGAYRELDWIGVLAS